MGLNIARQPATPESNAEAANLLSSFLSYKEQGCTFGFWTNKVITEISDLIAKDLQVEDYDLEQLKELAGKDLRQFLSVV